MFDAVQEVATNLLPLQVSSVPVPLLARKTTSPSLAEAHAGSAVTVVTASA